MCGIAASNGVTLLATGPSVHVVLVHQTAGHAIDQSIVAHIGMRPLVTIHAVAFQDVRAGPSGVVSVRSWEKVPCWALNSSRSSTRLE